MRGKEETGKDREEGGKDARLMQQRHDHLCCMSSCSSLGPQKPHPAPVGVYSVRKGVVCHM